MTYRKQKGGPYPLRILYHPTFSLPYRGLFCYYFRPGKRKAVMTRLMRPSFIYRRPSPSLSRLDFPCRFGLRLSFTAFANGFFSRLWLTALAYDFGFQLWLTVLAYGFYLRFSLTAFSFSCPFRLLLMTFTYSFPSWLLLLLFL